MKKWTTLKVVVFGLLGFNQAPAQTPTPLEIQCPSNLVVWTCSTNPVPVRYPDPAIRGGDCRTGPAVICNPSSGSLFALGTSTVNCTATNVCGERDSCLFTVTVNRDTAPPTITCPSNILVRTCGTKDVAVNYPQPTAADDQDRDPTITCTPAAGSAFPPGATTVQCVATDDCTNRSICTFTITVEADTSPPVIRCPEDILVQTCDRDGVAVSYPPPVVADDTDLNPSVACNPPSGSAFPPGSTTVSCVATDACTNRSQCTFTVRVETDTTPPVITCPTNIVVQACETNGVVVNYPVPAVTDDYDPNPTVLCMPASGSVFPLGNTMVQCSAVDACTNRAFCTFTVTVSGDATPPLITCPTNVTVGICPPRPSTCEADPRVPLRPASIGNGLFYGAKAEPDLTQLAFAQEMFWNAEAGYHPTHVNAYRPVGASGTGDTEFAAAWVRDDDSAFPYGFANAATVDQLLAAEQAQQALRPVSLSGYRLSPNETRFAVAYLNDGAEFPWRLILDKDFDEYQEEIEALAAQHYRPICVSGYSHYGENARFSGIFVQDGLGGANWITSHGIPEEDYQAWFDNWAGQGFEPISVSAYTVGTVTFFTAVMVRLNTGAGFVASHGITEADFNTANQHWMDPSNEYGTVLRPVVVAAYTSQFQSGAKRYAAVWRTSSARSFTKTGDLDPLLAAFDDGMENFMKSRDINSASLCVAKDGQIQLHRGYTWAPTEFEITEPCSRFRVASASKALTATAVMKLLESPILVGIKGGGLQALTLDTPVFQINGMPDLPPEYGAAAQQITIRQLLRHRAGWDRDKWEPLYSDLTIAAALGQNVPASRLDRINYMMTPSLWGAPGDPTSVGYVFPPDFSAAYSNFGYSLLAELIEVISNEPYEQFVRNHVLLPVGAQNMRLGRTARLLKWTSPDEVTYTAGNSDAPSWYVSDANYAQGNSANPTTQSRVGLAEPGASFPTTAYGRYNVHTIDGAGGWVATTDDLVRFLSSFDSYDPDEVNTHTPLLKWSSVWQMWSNPNNVSTVVGNDYLLGWQRAESGGELVHFHGGDIDGAKSIIYHRSDGITIAAMVSRNVGPGLYTMLNNVVNSIASWPANTNGTVVHYPAPMASDDTDRDPDIKCDPPSGSFFPVGATTVTCTATDNCTNQSSCTFTVTVQIDDAPPVIQCPSNIVRWVCGTNAVAVTYPLPTATDSSGRGVSVTCTPPSGSLFPVGQSTVACVATDPCGNNSTCTFTVTVNVDKTPPVITCPPDVVVDTCNTFGAVATYPKPTAIDNHDPNPTVVCTPPSGTMFPVGATTVMCVAVDDCTNRTFCSFTVTVGPAEAPPPITCPSNLVAYATTAQGAVVTFSATAHDVCGRDVYLKCDPPSGSVFPIGPSTVVCHAIDDRENESWCSFLVEVRNPRLTIVRERDRLIVAWPGGAVLEQAREVTGPWTVVDQPSPYILSLTASDSRGFFRLDGFAAPNPGQVFDLDLFEQNIQQAMAGQSLGYAYAINQNGMLVREGGFGPARTAADPPELMMSPTLRMNIASASKTITAVAVLKLLEQKGLTIDDFVAPYLPPDWVLGPGVASLTFKQLLTHTSGLAGGNSKYPSLQAAIEQGLAADQSYNYNNQNFAMFRIIIPHLWDVIPWAPNTPIDELLGYLFEAYVQQEVFAPMGFEAWTHQTDTPPMLLYKFPYDGAAQGYAPNDSLLVAGPKGWFLSAREMAAFLAHVRFGNVLSENSKNLMDTWLLGWHPSNSGQGDHGPYYGHAGDLFYGAGTVHSCLMDFPNGVQATIIINSSYAPSQGQMLKNAFDNAWVNP